MNKLGMRLGPNQDGEGAFPDLDPYIKSGQFIHIINDQIEVSGLKNGMDSGKPSASFLFTLPDGRKVLCETSLSLFLTAADHLKAVFGDPRI